MNKEKVHKLLLNTTKEDKDLFNSWGELNGWSLSKTIRIACRAFILMSGDPSLNRETALSKAIRMEKV